ncbi:hypothetical protein C3L33_22091, partial [Rhododendron williamsianum]
MPDHSRSHVHLAYLTLLEDFTVVRSWGSACLANLYHYLCHGCQSGKENVGGAFILVQLWARERFPYVAPGRKGWRRRPAGFPLSARWHNHFHSPDLATHVLGAYRHYFDMQKVDEIWNNRLEHVLADGEADPHAYEYPPDDPYVLWYERIKLRYVSHLGGAVEMARKLFERLRMMEVVELDVIRSIGA